MDVCIAHQGHVLAFFVRIAPKRTGIESDLTEHVMLQTVAEQVKGIVAIEIQAARCGIGQQKQRRIRGRMSQDEHVMRLERSWKGMVDEGSLPPLL